MFLFLSLGVMDVQGVEERNYGSEIEFVVR